MKISNIQAMRNYIYKYSGFTEKTINNVIEALGYHLQGSGNIFNELSSEFENCAEHGANCGFGSFIYCNETISFYMENRKDIVRHIENTADELGTDIISMVQCFGVFQNSEKPTVGEVGKALYDSGYTWPELTTLYNVFAWYALEEVSRTWYRYLEENPAYHTELSA